MHAEDEYAGAEDFMIVNVVRKRGKTGVCKLLRWLDGSNG